MKNVLLATDGSPSALAAARWVADLGVQAPGLKVTVLHVLADPGGWLSAMPDSGIVLPEAPLAKAAGIIRRAKAVIGTRLHAIILAARYAVPFIAVPYDPKVTALCEDLAYPLAPLFVPGAAERPSFDTTDALVDRLWSQRDELSAHLAAASARLRDLAARNFEVLDELVAERVPNR